MPTYTYECPKCGLRFDVFHSISDDSPNPCPECGEKAERQFGGGSFISKDSGDSSSSQSIPFGGFS